MNRCIKCIMPETTKGIKFDENGLCQLCKDYKEFIPKGREILNKEIAEYLNNGNEDYNCVVPVSGGRDSSYALYFAKKVLGLKPLAVHNNNDFETNIANNNLEVITKSLNVPLIRISSKIQISKKIVAEKFKMNTPFGPGLIVDQTCEACKYGFESVAYNTARKYSIKLIIWGDSTDESTEPYHRLIKNEHKIPTKWERLRKPAFLNYLKYKRHFRQMKIEYGPDYRDGLKEIHLYDYIKWDRRTIVNTIQEKMNWSAPKDSPTTWRIDCSLIPLVNYLTEKAYGVSKIELGFSNMIRGGKMDRNDALKQVKLIRKNTKINELKGFLKDIGISSRFINQVL